MTLAEPNPTPAPPAAPGSGTADGARQLGQPDRTHHPGAASHHPTDPTVLRGTAGARGPGRAPAEVVRSPGEAAGLRTGDALALTPQEMPDAGRHDRSRTASRGEEGRTVEAAARPSRRRVLQGTAASPGRSRGPARLVRSAEDLAAARPGDVLVLPNLPASWVPLLPAPAAVVAETGGALCNAAIRLRELGVPAALGVAGAMGAIADGQVVDVDGRAGVVSVAPAGADTGEGPTP